MVIEVNLRYKIVEYSQGVYQAYHRDIQAVIRAAEKESGEIFHVKFPDYREKEKTMEKADFEAFMQKNYSPIRDGLVIKRVEEHLEEFTPFIPEESDRLLTFSFFKYLELLINRYATQGWILDKIKTKRNSEMDGYLVFRK